MPEVSLAWQLVCLFISAPVLSNQLAHPDIQRLRFRVTSAIPYAADSPNQIQILIAVYHKLLPPR